MLLSHYQGQQLLGIEGEWMLKRAHFYQHKTAEAQVQPAVAATQKSLLQVSWECLA